MTASVTETTQPTESTTDVRLRVFAALWAIGHLMHLVNDSGRYLDDLAGVAVVFAAIRVLEDPGSIRRLGYLAGFQVIHVVWTAPLLPDHWVLAAAGNLVILVSIVRVHVGGRDDSRSRSEVDAFAVAMPALRLVLLIGYSAAAIAKYNTTFLEPVTSCATWLTETATGGLVGDINWLGSVHVAAAIVPETLIPIMLIIPRTRRFGVRFGIAFHLLLAISPLLVVGDFSVLLTALFLLFASDEDVRTLLQRIRHRVDADPFARRLRQVERPVVRAVVLTVGIVAIARYVNMHASPWVWIALVMVVPRVLSSLMRMPDQFSPGTTAFGRVSAPQLAVAALLLTWVLLPYAGLRTTGVLTMFSNLRTEGPGTNHLFMPSFHLTDHQTDLVIPGEGSSEGFDDLIENGQAVSVFELRRAVAADADLVVVGERNGVEIGEDDLDDFRQPNSGLANRLMQTRPVPATGHPPCIN